MPHGCLLIKRPMNRPLFLSYHKGALHATPYHHRQKRHHVGCPCSHYFLRFFASDSSTLLFDFFGRQQFLCRRHRPFIGQWPAVASFTQIVAITMLHQGRHSAPPIFCFQIRTGFSVQSPHSISPGTQPPEASLCHLGQFL